MNILFLFASLPDLSSDDGLFSSLIHCFVKHGHQIYVSSRGNNIRNTGIKDEGGISVLRIKCPEFTRVSNNVKKALAYQEYAFKQRLYVKKYWGKKKIDMIISHSLPPELAYIVGGLKRHFKCKFYLEVPDYTWQDAVAYGYFRKNGPIGLYYRFWERKMFKEADYIGVPTKGNVSFIRNMYPWINEDVFKVFPFWLKPFEVEKDESLKEQLGLKDKFVVIYGGSVGAAQRIEHFVELAESCSENKDMVFLLLGRGAYLPVIRRMVQDKHLTNVMFKDFIPQQDYLRLLASCDVGMIILNEQMATPNFPSKSLSYLNMKVPILAALDHVTDFGVYLEENGAGLWSYSDDIKGLKKQLLKYYNSKELREETARRGYELFINNMTPECAYKFISSQIGIKYGIYNQTTSF